MVKMYDTNPDTRKMIGTTINSTATFKDERGNLVNPVDVEFSYRKPDTVTVGTGNVEVNATSYTSTVFLDQAGTWYFRWECAGNYAAAKEFTVYVVPSSVE